jgi:N-glycosylase/DNA lyase
MTKSAFGRAGGWGLIEAPGFDLEVSMTCGQIFGWEKRDGAYWGLIGSFAVGIRQEEDRLSFTAAPGVSHADVVRYLGLDEDLDAILQAITVDDFMEQVVSSVKGLRLLRQDPWPCLCSYIISANNRVDRIDLLVKEIAKQFGNSYRVGEHLVYGLPDPPVLAGCMESGLRACGVGFRAPYLLDAARLVADGSVDFDAVGRMAYEDAREVLKTIPGVGDKIADCVLLFGFSKYESFPVDIWIKRAIQQVYFGSRETRNDDIRRFGQEHFGKYAGYAQEYIYHYSRTQPLV